jgi:transcriptional regulator with XRE-family HTH domain
MPSLTDYLATRKEAQTDFCTRAGLSDATLSRVLRGKIPPSPDVVEKVHQATDGEVTANDLFDAWRTARSSTPAAPEAA